MDKVDKLQGREDCTELERLEIRLLLEAVCRHYGYDFRNYAFSYIRRRIWHRMRSERLHTVTGLLDKLLHDPAMMDKLFHDFSINVTEMFRDPSFFRTFRERVVPQLRLLPELRIWHAGCATGEEVFSMAILLQEEGLLERSTLYATDINEQVLDLARGGVLPLDRMKGFTNNYMLAGGTKAFSEYYTAGSEGVRLRPGLLERIVFGRHNLVTDGSINEFHVIICRNVLIYFNRELQDRVHRLFYESLAPNGILALGSREGIRLTACSPGYDEFAPDEKIYRKRA